MLGDDGYKNMKKLLDGSHLNFTIDGTTEKKANKALQNGVETEDAIPSKVMVKMRRPTP